MLLCCTGSMFWLLAGPFHPDFDDYSIYYDGWKYPHNPQPVVPNPSPTPCQQPVNGEASHLLANLKLCCPFFHTTMAFQRSSCKVLAVDKVCADSSLRTLAAAQDFFQQKPYLACAARHINVPYNPSTFPHRPFLAVFDSKQRPCICLHRV